MNLLRRLFAIRRLARPPKDHAAGRLLPPASVQRSHLGLADVDLPRGVVRLRSGEVRAVLRVTGVALQHLPPAKQHDVLVKWAEALTALPPDVACLARSLPGGLEPHIAQRRTQATALAQRRPGSGLARLAQDQLTHAERLQADGTTRKTENWLAVRNARGDVGALLRDRNRAADLLNQAGVRTEVVREQALARAIAESWHPALREQTFLRGRDQESDDYIDYWPGKATVRMAPDVAAPRATIRPAAERVLAG